MWVKVVHWCSLFEPRRELSVVFFLARWIGRGYGALAPARLLGGLGYEGFLLHAVFLVSLAAVLLSNTAFSNDLMGFIIVVWTMCNGVGCFKGLSNIFLGRHGKPRKSVRVAKYEFRRTYVWKENQYRRRDVMSLTQIKFILYLNSTYMMLHFSYMPFLTRKYTFYLSLVSSQVPYFYMLHCVWEFHMSHVCWWSMIRCSRLIVCYSRVYFTSGPSIYFGLRIVGRCEEFPKSLSLENVIST